MSRSQIKICKRCQKEKSCLEFSRTANGRITCYCDDCKKEKELIEHKKECNTCNILKPIYEFLKTPAGNRAYNCNSCVKNTTEFINYLKENKLKVCGICQKEKSFDLFSKCSKNKDGLDWICKECKSNISKENRKNPETLKKLKERSRSYNTKNRELIRRKARLKRQQHKFIIMAEDANRWAREKSCADEITPLQLFALAKKQKLICPISGIKLTSENISPDHIIPFSRGGENIIENIQLVDKDINFMKHSLSEEKFFKIIKTIYEYQSTLEKQKQACS